MLVYYIKIKSKLWNAQGEFHSQLWNVILDVYDRNIFITLDNWEDIKAIIR